jgi:hypothetical protein
MKVSVAHLRDQGISFAVFGADARDRTDQGRDETLARLVDLARRNGLRVDKAALAFRRNGRLVFHGTPDLVRYLAARPSAVRWTHTLDA